MRQSNLSRTPPCPGIKFDESFTSQYLFIIDSNMSPAWLNTPAIIPRTTKSVKLSELPENRFNINAVIIVNIKPVTDPSTVFLGLMSDSLCLPNNFPPKNANVSQVHIKRKMLSIK